jgi:hypothetical protein
LFARLDFATSLRQTSRVSSANNKMFSKRNVKYRLTYLAEPSTRALFFSPRASSESAGPPVCSIVTTDRCRATALPMTAGSIKYLLTTAKRMRSFATAKIAVRGSSEGTLSLGHATKAKYCRVALCSKALSFQAFPLPNAEEIKILTSLCAVYCPALE